MMRWWKLSLLLLAVLAFGCDSDNDEIVVEEAPLGVVFSLPAPGILPSPPYTGTENLTATFKLCKGVMRGMMKARWGRIVNISSVVGATGNPGQANYAASKAGMVGMSKSLAYEVASRGITVNAVAPGFIETAMTDKLTDDQKAGIMGQIPAGRMGSPEEIAAGVVYLASPEAAYVTGTTLHVNGGMAMI